jgi:hypothetical protein
VWDMAFHHHIRCSMGNTVFNQFILHFLVFLQSQASDTMLFSPISAVLLALLSLTSALHVPFSEQDSFSEQDPFYELDAFSKHGALSRQLNKAAEQFDHGANLLIFNAAQNEKGRVVRPSAWMSSQDNCLDVDWKLFAVKVCFSGELGPIISVRILGLSLIDVQCPSPSEDCVISVSNNQVSGLAKVTFRSRGGRDGLIFDYCPPFWGIWGGCVNSGLINL